MLQILLSELTNLGQRYTAVAILPGLDAEAPSTLGFEVRFTVQDVILARTDRPANELTLSNVQAQNYLTQLTFPTVIGPITNPAGWASVDVQIRGRKFRFVTTHLAIAPNFDPTVPLAQAQELIATAGNTELPVVFVGDFNSLANDATNPTFETYQSFIDAGFVDTWLETHPVDPGFTCCQAPDVSNFNSLLSVRIDLVFIRGGIGVVNERLVGDKQADRTPSGLWPSDHAGVLARLRFPGLKGPRSN
jgi:endonuclease/exonuclease/phosphatase family metal-dependent hydrolase